MIIERETRFAHTVLHETKDKMVEVFKTVLPRLGKTAKIIKFDCAAEYNTPQLVKLLKEDGAIEFWHSNEHGQAANGMVGKFGDTLGRGLRAALLQSGMPFAFWGAAVILVMDIYNSCPHTSLHGDSPQFSRTGKHPDMSFFRPFGCGMVERDNVVYWKEPKGRSRMISDATNPLKESQRESLLGWAGCASI